MKAPRIFGLVLVAALSVSCTQGTASLGKNSSSPPVSASPSGAPLPLVAMVTRATSSPAIAAVHFFDLAGHEVRSVRLPNGSAGFATVGGSSVFFVDRETLESVDSSGRISVHGSLGATIGCCSTRQVRTLAVSPDGRRWVWNVVTPNKDQSETTKLYLDGVGLSPRLILKETSSTNAYTVDPVFWSQGGIALANLGIGLGGLVFFSDSYWYPTRLLDPKTLMTSPLSQTDNCFLTDVASDGTWICVGAPASNTAPRHAAIRIHEADGNVRSFATQAGEQFGNALISQDRRRVAFGVFLGVKGSDYPLATYIIDLTTGKTSRIGMDGDIPEAWLPDGSLVLFDADFAHKHQRTTIVRPDGSVVSLGSGEFVGYLDASRAVARRDQL